MDIDNTKHAPATEDELNAIMALDEHQLYRDTSHVRNAQGRIIGGSASDSTYNGPDDALTVQFSTEATFNKLLTFRNGGVPKYVDMDFVTISTPGDNSLVVHSPVSEYHKWRFPIEYENFKKGQGELLSGTPLTLWPLLSQSQIREMNNLNIRTVEQVAKLSDSSAGALAGFYGLKHQAEQFLKIAGDKAEQGKLQAELDSRDSEHKSQLAAMQAQMDQLTQMLMAHQAPKVEDEPKPEKASKTK